MDWGSRGNNSASRRVNPRERNKQQQQKTKITKLFKQKDSLQNKKSEHVRNIA